MKQAQANLICWIPVQKDDELREQIWFLYIENVLDIEDECADGTAWLATVQVEIKGENYVDKKTEGVEIFVKEVLASISPPYGEDIILRVFQAIEGNPEWERSYQSLSNDVGDGWSNEVINTWIGKYVKDQVGLNTLREVSAEGKCKLIKTYSKLGR